MSHEATRWAWSAFANHQDLAATRRIVLLALAECHNWETGQCNPSLDRLIQMTGLKRHTLPAAIRDLESQGLIAVVRGRGQKSSYQLKTSAENGTSAVMGTSAENGTTPVPKTALPPVPKTALASKPGIEPGKNQEITTATTARASQTDDKRPSGASEGGQGGHQGEPAQPVERERKSRPQKIPMVLGWMPDPTLWGDFDELGIDRKFAEACMPEFRRYFIEQGEKRPGWERSFLAWVKRDWEKRERQQGGTNITPLRPVPSGHRNGDGNFRTFEQMRAENTNRAIDDFLCGDKPGATIDVGKR